MVSSRSPQRPLLACLLALLACSSRERAGAIIEVTSDLAVPAQLDHLLFRITGVGPDQERVYDLEASPSAHALPARLALEGAPGQRIEVEVIGRQDGDDLVSSRVSVTLLVAPPVVCVTLAKACSHARGPGPEACVPNNPECRPRGPLPDAITGDTADAAAEPPGAGDGAPSIDTPSEAPPRDAGVARAWTQIVAEPTLPTPEPRGEPVMVVDTTRRKMILFGGKTAHDTALPRDDLWELDLETLRWAKRGPPETSSLWPRSAAVVEESWWPPAAAYDEGHKRVVFYGLGARRTDEADVPVWEWDGSAGVWSPGAGLPRMRAGTGLNALLRISAAHDAARSVDVILVNYYVDAYPLEITYERRLGQTPLAVASNSPTRDAPGSSVFYDPVAERVRVLRHATVDNRPALERWTWSPSPPAWQNEGKPVELGRSFSGGELFWASEAFDAQSGRVFFYSFPATAPDFGYELLLWSAQLRTGALERWSSSGPQPLARQWPGLVADPTTGTLLLFGGYRDRPTGDLWRWDRRGGNATTLGP